MSSVSLETAIGDTIDVVTEQSVPADTETGL